MKKTMDINFRRVVRDCPANAARTDTRSLIYDFEVLIDGEHRATFHRIIYGRGYDLVGPGPVWEELYCEHAQGRADYQMTYCRAKADKKEDFAGIIYGMLQSDLIPTIADYQQRLAGWGRALLIVHDLRMEELKAHAVQERATDFLRLAQLVHDGVDCKKAAGILLDEVVQRQADFAEHERPLDDHQRAAVAAFNAIGEI